MNGSVEDHPNDAISLVDDFAEDSKVDLAGQGTYPGEYPETKKASTVLADIANNFNFTEVMGICSVSYTCQ